ncbi:MAG: transglycosylase SLT domain-containing protein [Cyclobacteriaceae bacterium]|nr:transglycosylase SLT domain-containing protein [Cyclobacteriaceae bacterium]
MKQSLFFISSFLAVVFVATLAFKPDKTIRVKSPGLYMPDTMYSEEYEVYSLPVIEIPDQLSFAGERIPLNDPDVRERIDREIHINTFWHTNTILLLKRSHRWLDEIGEIVKSYNIPEDFKYLPVVESDLRNVVSPKKAVGFWQILEGTARELGLEVNQEVDERYDPIKSTHAACRQLIKNYQRFGNWSMAAAAYNAGPAGVNRAVQSQKLDHYWDLLLNEETSRYVARMVAIKLIFENPQAFGFRLEKKHLYPKEKTRSIIIEQSIPDLTEFAFSQGVNYKILKRYNPWLRQNRLTVNAGKSYTILLPADPYWKMPEQKTLPRPNSLNSGEEQQTPDDEL